MPEVRNERNWNFRKAYFFHSQSRRARSWQSLDLNPCLFRSKVHVLSTGGGEWSKDREAKTERSCTTVREKGVQQVPRQSTQPSLGVWIEEAFLEKEIFELRLKGLKLFVKGVKPRKVVVYVGRRGHKDHSYSFGQSPFLWGWDFLVLSPSSCAPCHCTWQVIMFVTHFLWGFQKNSHSGWNSALHSANRSLCDYWLITSPLWDGVILIIKS